MKRILSVAMVLAMLLCTLVLPALAETKTYPDGVLQWWSTGQPEFRKQYFDTWLEAHRDIAPGVSIEATAISTTNDGQQKIAMYNLAGDYEAMPEILFLDTVGVVNMAMNDLLLDVTDYYTPIADQFVDGAAADATINGVIYALPDAVRPQMLFYNAAIFEEYDVDPSTYTWRYWGRRGLMPQAGARIWDDEGNVVIGEDPGTKLALGFFDQLCSEGLLYKTNMMQQPLYEATDEGKIATFYIGAFWDEFMRGNLTKTVGDWRVMPPPVFEEVGTSGAPVSTYFCLVDTHDDTYTDLILQMWYDFATDGEAYKTWVNKMTEINGPYNNPISKEMLTDPFWQEPSDFYGGQSFRKAESDALANPSTNMVVTPSDAEADEIISAEIEKYVAGEQTMDEAIANMDRELKTRIGQAQMP